MSHSNLLLSFAIYEYVMGSVKISNTKLQIPNKFQSPISNDPNSFVWDFGNWCLFVIWCLEFGAYPNWISFLTLPLLERVTENIIIELNPIEKEPLTLELLWTSHLHFEEPVHYIYCIVVQQWADTGEIKYIAPISGSVYYSPSDSPAQPTETPNDATNPPNTALIFAAGCAIAAVITGATVVAIKNRRNKQG